MKETDLWKQMQGKALFHLKDTQSALDLLSQMNEWIEKGVISEGIACLYLEETIRFYTQDSVAHDTFKGGDET